MCWKGPRSAFVPVGLPPTVCELRPPLTPIRSPSSRDKISPAVTVPLFPGMLPCSSLIRRAHRGLLPSLLRPVRRPGAPAPHTYRGSAAARRGDGCGRGRPSRPPRPETLPSPDGRPGKRRARHGGPCRPVHGGLAPGAERSPAAARRSRLGCPARARAAAPQTGGLPRPPHGAPAGSAAPRLGRPEGSSPSRPR